MLLTITNTQKPATDLGFLLHKNPMNVHPFKLPVGNGLVFYPEATEDRCTAALLINLDPVKLVRGKGVQGKSSYPLDQYVNDRPYAASSFLSVAISRGLSNAMNGSCKRHPELVEQSLPLEAHIPILPCFGGETLLRKLFEPCGYEVIAKNLPLDEKFAEWGSSPYFSVTLKGKVRLQDLLTHIYVLVPVLDNDKHYWIGKDEVDKLLDKGKSWLKKHPEKDQIAQRYLKNRRSLARKALEQLVHDEDPDLQTLDPQQEQKEEVLEKKISLNNQRLETITSTLKEAGIKTVIDLGCGEGKLIRSLLKVRSFKRIVGMDVSVQSLERAHETLKMDRMTPRQLERLELFHGSLIYKDPRFDGFEGAVLAEVIEHLDLNRLTALERVVFEFAKPKTVIITTPNSEYNVKFENLQQGKFRHSDHRFEWTRKEFQTWAQKISETHGYQVTFLGIGDHDDELGAPTQMGVFELL